MDSPPEAAVAARDPHQPWPADMAAAPAWLVSLRDTCALLWPPPAEVSLDASGAAWSGWRHARKPDRTADREFALFPGARRLPLLVPTGRQAAAAAVRHHSATRSPAARLYVRALSVCLAGGLCGAMLRPRVWIRSPDGSDTIDRYLTSVMSCDLQMSIEVGRPRANRKPVLQLLNGSGEAVGFAKVGINPLTSRLVRAEHESLTRLSQAGLTEIAIPEVLHYGIWRDLDVLVLSALPAWRPRRPLPHTRLVAAMAELAGVDGLTTEPLAGGGYLGRLRARLATADESPEHEALEQALDKLAAQMGDTVLSFGCWHGDWAPWNMANTGHGLLVWDWERFTRGVPLGFDALHYWLQREVGMSRRDPRTAAGACLEHAPRLLGSFGIAAAEAELTAVLYLADLATRYLVDRQAQAGARLGATGTWLVPAIVGKLDRLVAS